MGVVVDRLRTRRAQQLPDARRAARGSGIDLWLVRVAHLSQALLLGLGVFGYFYTVVPVYEKALLDEEIAKKTLELNEKSTELLTKAEEVNRLSVEIAARTKDLRAKEAELASANLGLQRARTDKAFAETKAQIAGLEAEVNYTKLRRQYLGAVLSHVRGCGLPSIFMGPLAGEFEACMQRVLDSNRDAFGQLKSGEYTRLHQAFARVVDDNKAAYIAIVQGHVRDNAERQAELKALEDSGKSAREGSTPRESYEVVSARLARERELRKVIRERQKIASDEYYRLLDKVADEIWRFMWAKG